MLAAGLGDDPLGDFLLEHQGQAGPPRLPLGRQPADEQRSADIIGQVGHDMRLAFEQRRGIDFQSVALDDAKLAGEEAAKLLECRDAAPVPLHRGDAGAALE
jgi:hypothetical protein